MRYPADVKRELETILDAFEEYIQCLYQYPEKLKTGWQWKSGGSTYGDR